MRTKDVGYNDIGASVENDELALLAMLTRSSATYVVKWEDQFIRVFVILLRNSGNFDKTKKATQTDVEKCF